MTLSAGMSPELGTRLFGDHWAVSGVAPERILGWILVAALGTAAAFELALALGAGSLGSAPGEGVPGESVASTAALLAMLLGAVVAVVAALRGRAVSPLLAPAAAAFLVAFYFTYDPYFAPSQRRYSDGGAASLSGILVVAGLAAGVGLLTTVRPRVGSVASALMLVIVLLTFLIAGDGH